MARIPYADPARIHPKARAVLESLPPGNIFRIIAHAETVLDPFNRMGGALLRRGTLDPRLRELAILRVGHLAKARYEIAQHEAIGRDVGLSEAEIAGLARGADDPAFGPREKAVLRFADDVAVNVRAGEPIFAAVAEFLDHRQMVELTLCVGFYMMVSRLLETFDVELEDKQLLTGFKSGQVGR
ncbi:MAG: carboxymuconolactone decarboxylase family protein [Alphaproteobacteria bacterium]|nr:carboxymuconolactone decarboxylase family protein [Alphaproteobacteria bacterium]